MTNIKARTLRFMTAAEAARLVEAGRSGDIASVLAEMNFRPATPRVRRSTLSGRHMTAAVAASMIESTATR